MQMSNIQSLISTEPTDSGKMVSVKLPEDLVSNIQAIRQESKKTNTQVYSALLSEGIKAYHLATGRTVNGNKRGRKKKIKSKVRVTRAKASEVS